MAILQRYLGEDFHYCEMYLQPHLAFSVSDWANAQKNHDFDLDTKIDPTRNYIVQIRDPIESTSSYYEWQLDRGRDLGTPELRRLFFKKTLVYWSQFVNKWVFDDVPSRLVVHYRDLVDLPEKTLVKVLEHLEVTVDSGLLCKTLEQVGVKNRAGVRTCPYIK